MLSNRSESEIQRAIQLACGAIPGVRLFRSNNGVAWTGETVQKGPRHIILENPRPFHAGLVKGSSDLIGWRSMTITPDMVGRRVAVFASIEVKSAAGRLSDDQRRWLEIVRAMGGIACVARDEATAVAAMDFRGGARSSRRS